MRRLRFRRRHFLVLLAIFSLCYWAVGTFDYYVRCTRWSPDITLGSEHYTIASKATEQQTRTALAVAETLYSAYAGFLGDVASLSQDHPKLNLRLYEDRAEFKLCNQASGWAEAFYRKPYCHQYIDGTKANPYHWMIHEATHQLNAEVAGLWLSRWLNEGLACYFSTSTLDADTLHLGRIDVNTYPIWWLPTHDLSGDMDLDVERAKVIPLQQILKGEGGPDIGSHFNTYYIHWWSLTHFCLHYDDGRYRSGFLDVIRDGGTYASFVENVGPINEIQPLWYRYLLQQTWQRVD